jgi:hypothetical protein
MRGLIFRVLSVTWVAFFVAPGSDQDRAGFRQGGALDKPRLAGARWRGGLLAVLKTGHLKS